eukprot:Pgem_evm1s5070
MAIETIMHSNNYHTNNTNTNYSQSMFDLYDLYKHEQVKAYEGANLTKTRQYTEVPLEYVIDCLKANIKLKTVLSKNPNYNRNKIKDNNNNKNNKDKSAVHYHQHNHSRYKFFKAFREKDLIEFIRVNYMISTNQAFEIEKELVRNNYIIETEPVKGNLPVMEALGGNEKTKYFRFDESRIINICK